ncbi:MAG TPA: flavin reductase family protein [Anaerolineaceae bacterium]
MQPSFLPGEPAHESSDPELLRQVMRHWTTGVTIVTSAVKDNQRELLVIPGMTVNPGLTSIHGMTVNSFTSISLNPPVVHVSLANTTRTHDLVKRSGVFGITILGEDQTAIADRFAGREGDEADRFIGLATFHLVTGSPLIEGGLAYLDCRVRTSLEVGSTTVFFGDVVAVLEQKDNLPLIYFNRLYRGLQK